MGDLILQNGSLKYKWGEKSLKISPLCENDLYIGEKRYENINKPLYRFMDEAYVDKFFSDGVLRLSNFEACRKLKDPVRNDHHEGFGTFSITDGRYSIEMCMHLGMNPLMLCTSTDQDAYPSHKCYLKIHDPNGLRDAITRGLERKGRVVRQFFQGKCMYGDRLIYRHIEPGNEAFENMLCYVGSCSRHFNYRDVDLFVRTFGGKELYFRKPLKYKREREYRMVWDCNRMEGDAYEDVIIDNPSDYAEKGMKN
jgi:hypothetical protein